MVKIIEIANHFGLTTVNGSKNSLQRGINFIQVDRPGLEINGFFKYHNKSKLCLIGNKEIALINSLDEKQVYQNMKKIANPSCPGIIFCHGNQVPKVVLRVCQETDCPVFVTKETTSSFAGLIINYLTDKLAPKTSLHACLLEVYGEGVLFLGKSGIGKSEIALELIKKGHRLIADDKVEVRSIRDKLIGSAPEITFGMMEVRGIGIIDVARMFGINAITSETEIKYAINLVPFNDVKNMERVGMTTKHMNVLNYNLPMVDLPVSAARSMAELVEAAVTNFKLKDFGFDSAFEFEKKLKMFNNRDEQNFSNSSDKDEGEFR